MRNARNRWNFIRKQETKTKRTLKQCEAAERYKKFGFEYPRINVKGKCSGCRNPDDGRLEQQCFNCKNNEYFIEEIAN